MFRRDLSINENLPHMKDTIEGWMKEFKNGLNYNKSYPSQVVLCMLHFKYPVLFKYKRIEKELEENLGKGLFVVNIFNGSQNVEFKARASGYEEMYEIIKPYCFDVVNSRDDKHSTDFCNNPTKDGYFELCKNVLYEMIVEMNRVKEIKEKELVITEYNEDYLKSVKNYSF